MINNSKISNKILGQKLRIIYTYYCKRNKKRLLELFSNREKFQKDIKYKNSRSRAVDRYIAGDNVGTSYFIKEYKSYKISEIKIDDEPLFTIDEFIDSDVKSFTNRLKELKIYELEESKKFNQNYKYIYLYDGEIISYKIDYSDSKSLSETQDIWSIRVLPPSNKKHLPIYYGHITFEQNMIKLMYENEFDHVMLLFETSFRHTSSTPLYNNIIYGVGIGINDKNQKIPVAKKIILTETKMSEDELGKYYLILNETQQLYTDENLNSFDEKELDASYLSKYQKKIDDLHRFFSNVKYSPYIKTSLAHHMIFTEFHAFRNMYRKFSMNQNYFLSNRKRVYVEFLRYLKQNNEKKVYMVLPIYKKSDNIFLYETLGKESIKKLVVQRAKTGVVFNIIFVIQRRADVEKYDFLSVTKELDIENINISYVYKKDIEKSPLGWDFFYAKSHNFVVAKEHLFDSKNFTIIQNRDSIKDYIKTFKSIQKKSLCYEKLDLKIENSVLKKLVGDWHIYFYGSFKNYKNEQILWSGKLEIDYSLNTLLIMQKSDKLQGEVTIKENQTFFTFLNQDTNNTLCMIVNNKSIDEITVVTQFSKQLRKDLDLISIGILSRKKLEKDIVKELLGDVNQALFKIDLSMQERVDDLVLKESTIQE